jgi:hypothetical protein
VNFWALYPTIFSHTYIRDQFDEKGNAVDKSGPLCSSAKLYSFMCLMLGIKTPSLLSPPSFPFSFLSKPSLQHSPSPFDLSISLPTMKNPLSSTISFSSQYRLLILTLLLFFVISTATRIPNYASLDTSSRNHRDSFKIQRYSPSSFPRKSTSSYWCNQFQRMKGGLHLGPPPPPPPPPSEIDPIYGVEKRLVPSGPNPLHN